MTPVGVGMEDRLYKVIEINIYLIYYLPMFAILIFSTFVMNSKAISRFSLFWMGSRGLPLYLRGEREGKIKVREGGGKGRGREEGRK